jgi:hypothetical protein
MGPVGLATGWAAARLLLGQRVHSRLGIAGRAGLAIGLGIGVLALAQFWADALGLFMGRSVTLVAFLLLVPPAVVLEVIRLRRSRGRSTTRRSIRRLGVLDGVLLVVIATAVVLVFLQATTAPLTQWDARAIWAFKARLLHESHTVDSEDFLDPDRVHPHPRYPLLVPVAMANLWHWGGPPFERPVKVLFPLFMLALVLVMGDALGEYLGRTMNLVLLALLAWCPMLAVHPWGAQGGHADVPLAFYYTASTLWVLFWFRTGSPRAAAMAGVLAAMAIFTKNEGLALHAVNVTCAGLAGLTFRRDRPRRMLVGWLILTLTPVLLSLPWFIVRSGIPAVEDEEYLVLLLTGQWNPALLPMVLESILREMFVRIDHWSVLWYLAVLAALANPKTLARPAVALAAGILLAALGIFVGAYLLSPWLDVEFQVAVTLPRVLLQIMALPLILVALVLAKGRPRDAEIGSVV